MYGLVHISDFRIQDPYILDEARKSIPPGALKTWSYAYILCIDLMGILLSGMMCSLTADYEYLNCNKSKHCSFICSICVNDFEICNLNVL